MEGDKTTVLPLAPTPHQKKGNLDLKEWAREQEKRERKSKKDIPSAFDDSLLFRLSVRWWWWKEVNYFSPSASFLGKFGASPLLPGTWSGSLGGRTIALGLVGRRSTVLLGSRRGHAPGLPLIPSLRQPRGWKDPLERAGKPPAAAVTLRICLCRICK